MSTTVPALRKPAHLVASRARLSWLIGALARALLVAALGIAAQLIWDDFAVPRGVWIGYAALAVIYCVAMPLTRYVIHRWETTPQAIYTRTGFLSVELLIVPFSRVQTVDLRRGPVERMLGLATVQVTTASGSSTVSIAGLAHDTAAHLVEQLTQYTQTIPGDAT